MKISRLMPLCLFFFATTTAFADDDYAKRAEDRAQAQVRAEQAVVDADTKVSTANGIAQAAKDSEDAAKAELATVARLVDALAETKRKADATQAEHQSKVGELARLTALATGPLPAAPPATPSPAQSAPAPTADELAKAALETATAKLTLDARNADLLKATSEFTAHPRIAAAIVNNPASTDNAAREAIASAQALVLAMSTARASAQTELANAQASAVAARNYTILADEAYDRALRASQQSQANRDLKEMNERLMTLVSNTTALNGKVDDTNLRLGRVEASLGRVEGLLATNNKQLLANHEQLVIVARDQVKTSQFAEALNELRQIREAAVKTGASAESLVQIDQKIAERLERLLCCRCATPVVPYYLRYSPVCGYYASPN